jgi:hypothetical protein
MVVSATTTGEKEVSDSLPVTASSEVTTTIQKTSNEPVKDTDAPEGAQGAFTIFSGAARVEATKVAKTKSVSKKSASQTSQGSSIAKDRPRRTCTLKSTSLGKPMMETLRKVSMDRSVSQKHMSDFFPKK